ncbi:MAG: 4-hydroxy-3-methylbut-2-enyl diphosphate reductase, partial [Clostridia bacterium]|nr:4-hydroxy-3-methylbut-2-enyl diphosphate reductase [Clostridia bacterium]
MEILIAPSAGFCFGVKNAVKITADLGDKACVLGELIHNNSVIEKLKHLGVSKVDSVSECPKDKTLVIRSHGVCKDVYHKIKESKLLYRDATCPFVAKIHTIIEDAGNKGMSVIIIGDKGHPEVTGSAGWTQGECIIVSDENDAAKMPVSDEVNYCVVVQTTFDELLYNKIIKIIERRCK